MSLSGWVNWQNLEHLVLILTFLSPFLPEKVLALLGPLKQIIKYGSGNFGHATNATTDQIEQQKADAEAKTAVRRFGKSRKR